MSVSAGLRRWPAEIWRPKTLRLPSHLISSLSHNRAPSHNLSINNPVLSPLNPLSPGLRSSRDSRSKETTSRNRTQLSNRQR